MIDPLVANLGQQHPPLRGLTIGLGPLLLGLTPQRGKLDAPCLDRGFPVGQPL